jgi:hypothetical protein
VGGWGGEMKVILKDIKFPYFEMFNNTKCEAL